MSGGKRIDDHKFFAGGMSRESVLPKGVHVQTHSSDGHEGHLSQYEDTDAKIRAQQEMNVKKAKGHPHKPGTRN